MGAAQGRRMVRAPPQGSWRPQAEARPGASQHAGGPACSLVPSEAQRQPLSAQKLPAAPQGPHKCIFELPRSRYAVAIRSPLVACDKTVTKSVQAKRLMCSLLFTGKPMAGLPSDTARSRRSLVSLGPVWSLPTPSPPSRGLCSDRFSSQEGKVVVAAPDLPLPASGGGQPRAADSWSLTALDRL